MHITYKTTTIAYSSKGKGNPLVLLHGFLETRHIWKDFADELSKKRQVICIDLPGHGASGNLSEVHSMKDMAEVVGAVLDELNIQKASMAGHSMGGYVILEFSKIFPTIPTALVLINSTPEADSEERRANRDRATALVQKNKDAFVSMAISNLMTPESNKKFEKEVIDLKEKALKFPIKGITAASQGMKIRTNSTEMLTNFKNQKIIIAGKEDPVLNFKEIQSIANQTKSSLEALPGGHLSYLEQKDALQNILHFID